MFPTLNWHIRTYLLAESWSGSREPSLACMRLCSCVTVPLSPSVRLQRGKPGLGASSHNWHNSASHPANNRALGSPQLYGRVYGRRDTALTTALHCTALHCTALHLSALQCTALHCTALHCSALHPHWHQSYIPLTPYYRFAT